MTTSVRAGMADLITRLRRTINEAGTATYDDATLQDVLDEHKTRIVQEPLEAERTNTSGTSYVYLYYRSRYRNIETGGTPYLQIEDSGGGTRGTADYTLDAVRGLVTMAADQMGTQLYLSGWAYDLNGAAADMWRMKAAAVADRYDVSLDGHSLSRSQLAKQCLDMAAQYDRKAQAVTVRAWRVGDDDA